MHNVISKRSLGIRGELREIALVGCMDLLCAEAVSDDISTACAVALAECSAASKEAENAANKVAVDVAAVHTAWLTATAVVDACNVSITCLQHFVSGASRIASNLNKHGSDFVRALMRMVLMNSLESTKQVHFDATSRFADFIRSRDEVRSSVSIADELASRAASMQDMIDRCNALLGCESDADVRGILEIDTRRSTPSFKEQLGDMDMTGPNPLQIDDALALISSYPERLLTADLRLRLDEAKAKCLARVSTLNEAVDTRGKAAREAAISYTREQNAFNTKKREHDELVAKSASSAEQCNQFTIEANAAKKAVDDLVKTNNAAIRGFLQFAKDSRFDLNQADKGYEDDEKDDQYRSFWTAMQYVHQAQVLARKANSALGSNRILKPTHKLTALDVEITSALDRVMKYGAATTRATLGTAQCIGTVSGPRIDSPKPLARQKTG